MKKRGLLVGILLVLSLNLISAGILSDTLENVGLDISLMAIFVLIFALSLYPLNKFFKGQGGISGIAAFSIATLATVGINKYDFTPDIGNFAVNVGIPSDIFEIIIGAITAIALILLFTKIKGLSVLIIGFLFLLAGLLGAAGVSLPLILIGAALMAAWFFLFRNFKDAAGNTLVRKGPSVVLILILTGIGFLIAGIYDFGGYRSIIIGLIALAIAVYLKWKDLGMQKKLGTAKGWLGARHKDAVKIAKYQRLKAKWGKDRLNKKLGYTPRKGKLLLFLIGPGLILAGIFGYGGMYVIIAGAIIMFIGFIRFAGSAKKRFPLTSEVAGLAKEEGKKFEKWKQNKQQAELQKYEQKQQAQQQAWEDSQTEAISHGASRAIDDLKRKIATGKDITKDYEQVRRTYASTISSKKRSQEYIRAVEQVLNQIDTLYKEWAVKYKQAQIDQAKAEEDYKKHQAQQAQEMQAKREQATQEHQEKAENNILNRIKKQMSIKENNMAKVTKQMQQIQGRLSEIDTELQAGYKNAEALHNAAGKLGWTKAGLKPREGETPEQQKERATAAREAYRNWLRQYDLNGKLQKEKDKLATEYNGLTSQAKRIQQDYNKLYAMYEKRTSS